MTDTNGRAGDEPVERRETYRSPDSSDQTDAAPVTSSDASTADTGPNHRADVPADTAANTIPEPVVTEHPVAEQPAAVAPPTTAAPTQRLDAQQPTTERIDAEQPRTERIEPATQVAPTPTPVPPPTHAEPQRAVYVEAPQPPTKKGNRGFGALIAFLATLVFALVWAALAAVVIAVNSSPEGFADSVSNFVMSPAFWTPVLAFFVFFLLLVLILNRAAWGWYIALGFLVGVLVYASYLLGAVITVSQQITPGEVDPFVRSITLTPLAIGAGIVAREISIWAGALVSARGKKVKARNLQAQADYEKETAERKAEYERARAGHAA